MAVDLGALVAIGIKAAKQAGAVASVMITQPKPAPDPISGVVTGSETTQTLDAVQAKPNRKYAKVGSAWRTSKMILFVAAKGSQFALDEGQTVAFAGVTGRITALDTYAPAGVAIAYELAIG